ncbi:unnamed protein product [Phytophthora lilii]|uniref:Unnamed protein product n=1 Tax=Phytophthora lilii TaxID=2077276 RepID=A0A9W6WU99_9STRA|nr:unnamed protein product [Phytophthora lilii]
MAAFLAEDEDAMRAFEAVLSFVEDFAVDETLPLTITDNGATTVELPVANGAEMSSNGSSKHESDSRAAGTDATLNSSPSDANQRSRRTLANGKGTAARPVAEAIKARRRAADNARKRMLRKAGVYADPNRARNERKLEIAYLREKVRQLEVELQRLHERPIRVPALTSESTHQETASNSMDSTEVQVSSRTLDFRADAADFKELLEHLDAAYREADDVLAANGLADMEMTQQDIHMREGELFAGNSSTDVRVKQIIRRYVEADRELIVWVATIAPIEIKRKAFAGLTSHHRNYAVIKRAKASTPERELSLLQLVSHVTLDSQEGTMYDPMYIRALTDFLLSNAAGNIKADQELIENVLMDETLQQH